MFAVHVRGGKLAPQSTIGDYLDCFVQLAAATPRYLPPEDWRRHVQLIRLLREFSCYDVAAQQTPAVDLPITRLPTALYQWVEKIACRAEGHPLASTMAVETAEVLWGHARGQRVYDWDNQGAQFSIEAMVDGLGAHEDREIADQKLKKSISQRDVGGLTVVARLPEGVQLFARDRPVDCGEGQLYFRIERCHLSQSWSGDRYDMLMKGGGWPLDLSRHFQFYGHAIIHLAEPSATHWEWWEQKPCVPKEPREGDRWVATSLPIRWITHTITYESLDSRCEPVPDDWADATGL